MLEAALVGDNIRYLKVKRKKLPHLIISKCNRGDN